MRRPSHLLLTIAGLLVLEVGCSRGDGSAGAGSGGGAESYSVGGTLSGLTGAGLVLENGSESDLAIQAGATHFTFAQSVASGGTYRVSIKAFPSGQSCVVTSSSGVARANVTNVAVTCEPLTIIQSWAAPTAWGARWAYSGTMLQHAWFDGRQLVEDPAIPPASRVVWAAPPGAPAQRSIGAFLSGARFGAGPFTAPYVASSDSAVMQPGDDDIIACAVVKPDYDPNDDGLERGILARGFSKAMPMMVNPHGGWVLHQMHQQFCFHYEYTLATCTGIDPNFCTCNGAGTSDCWGMIYTPTFFAFDSANQPRGPLDTSWAVFCAGRSVSEERTRVVVNDVESLRELFVPATARLDPSPYNLTIGGYAPNADPGNDANHLFSGLIYETAVWHEPATVQNLRAKLAVMRALDPGVSYARNREGPFLGTDGQLHSGWRDAPRVDHAKGMLFGLQSWNRLSSARLVTPADEFHPYDVLTPGEDLSLAAWTRAGSVTIGGTIAPPGDSSHATVPQVTLGPGASLATTVQHFDSAGPVQALLWIRPVTGSGRLTATLRSTGSTADVDLAAYPAGAWSPVTLHGLTSNAVGTATDTFTLSAASANASPVTFYLWGLDLTQIGGGGDLGTFDAGVHLYDWSAEQDFSTGWPLDVKYPQDVLQLPAVPTSTSSTGYCVAASAQPYDGAAGSGSALAWDAPMHASRVAVAWLSDVDGAPPGTPPTRITLAVNGLDDAPARQLCFTVAGAAVCAPIPSNWSPGSAHLLAGCVSRAGEARLYGDGALLGGPLANVPIVDLATGHLLVGNGAPDATWGRALPNEHGTPPSYPVSNLSRPWHGYVSHAAVCADPLAAGCR